MVTKDPIYSIYKCIISIITCSLGFVSHMTVTWNFEFFFFFGILLTILEADFFRKLGFENVTEPHWKRVQERVVRSQKVLYRSFVFGRINAIQVG